MSLDIYLTNEFPACDHCGREAEETQVASFNITHNLGKMAEEAGLYKAMWRPEELNIKCAAELVGYLRLGLRALNSSPEKFKKLNPKNGWGDYDGLVRVATDYLEACIKNPRASVHASR